MDGKTAVAVTGIAATAAVGLAAAGLGWVTSRDDRATQRSLAHDARVYDRKANAYLAAIAVIHKQQVQLDTEFFSHLQRAPDDPPRPGPFAMANDADATQRAAIVAFGSSPIVALYKTMEHDALVVYSDDTFLWGGFRPPSTPAELSAEKAREATKLLADLDRLRKRWARLQTKFEDLVHTELS